MKRSVVLAGAAALLVGVTSCSSDGETSNKRAADRAKAAQHTAPAVLRAKNLQLVSPTRLAAASGRSTTAIADIGGGFAGGPALALADGSANFYLTTQFRNADSEFGDPNATGEPGFDMKLMIAEEGATPRLYATGSYSVAASASGKIAYNQGDGPYRNNLDYLTKVVVRNTLTAPPETWLATPRKYSVIAWAGDHLFVSRTLDDLEGGGPLLMMDGPEQVTTISECGRLVAISPDGSQFMYVSRTADECREPPIGNEPIRLWDIPTGASSAVLDQSQTAGLQGFGGGPWVGDRVVLPVYLKGDGKSAGNPVSGFGVMTRGADGHWTLRTQMLDPAVVESPGDVFVSSDGTIGALVSRPQVTLESLPGVPKLKEQIAPGSSPLKYSPFRAGLVTCREDLTACRLETFALPPKGGIYRVHNPSRPLAVPSAGTPDGKKTGGLPIEMW